ncbi:uncharacterized protein TNCV_1026611 [Trichonephila clavipes]|nr:uncharacterized protein TNCV_1026611 [Trichonephila clavipes]
MNLTWRNLPAHHWYAAKSPGLSIQCRSSRAHQTALSRLRSGYLRSMTFVQGGQERSSVPLDIDLTLPRNGWPANALMRYDRALRHTSSLRCLETFRSIFAITLSLVRSNSWGAKLAVSNDPRYARLETNLGIGQAKEGIEAFTTGSPQTNTIVITAVIESGFDAKDDVVPSRCSPISSCVAPLQTVASMGGCQGSTRNGRRDPKCSSAKRLRMVREDTGASSEGATCAWIAGDESFFGYTRAFFTMWWSSRRLVCRGCPEPGLRVNAISQIHWSQHLLTIQSEWPN